ncbi:glycosyltransferase [Mesorhizobium sp. NBSH29]|uniref:glycosyltransferase family 2 protein n=1 Tax=Mesorhizobium sp. NBSH29 TaxID=2654249 RepID=UPI0018967B75|nr:glycosyltransferase family A protein [Mesorhizobium sp. NBSH29]QPC86301.1 glycosyltransferase [Mesorhizobium sp. NBSH29]
MGAVISVIMATYNRGRHIVPSIRSVLAQTHGDLELLIVGDNCTDDTQKVVRPFLGERVRWVNLSERCGSQSFPNNAGIAAAKGDIIAYIGHDDIWLPNHLATLASLFDTDRGLDFAVGGAIFHGPRGSDFREITGLFAGDDAPFEHFFPPSSFAHRAHVTDRIGIWKHPQNIRAPVDADFLLRAARAGLRFRSTQAISVHKFAAGHRYLSYLVHESGEQERMLEHIQRPRHDSYLQGQLRRAHQAGTFMHVRHLDFDQYPTGYFATANARVKGNLRPNLITLEVPETLLQDDAPRALDWQLPADPTPGIRFVGCNPRPRILIPFRRAGKAFFSVTFFHHHRLALNALNLCVNGRSVAVSMGVAEEKDALYMTRAGFAAPLAKDDYSVITLRLSREQALRTGRQGLGVGDVKLQPIGIDVKLKHWWAGLKGRTASPGNTRDH